MLIQKLLKKTFAAILTVGIALTLIGATSSAAYANDAGTYKQQIHAGTNNYRASNGLAPVYASAYLDSLAQSWANQLAQTGDYKHNPNLQGTVFSQPGWTRVGENLVAQRDDGNQAVQAWIESSGHRANLLGDYDRMGIGVAFGGPYGKYYVQVFGKNPSSSSEDIYGAPTKPAPAPQPQPQPQPEPQPQPQPEPQPQPQPQPQPTETAPTNPGSAPAEPAKEEQKDTTKKEVSKRDSAKTIEDRMSKRDKSKTTNSSGTALDDDSVMTTNNGENSSDENIAITEMTASEILTEAVPEKAAAIMDDAQTRGSSYLAANMSSPQLMSKNVTILGASILLFAVAAQLLNVRRTRSKTRTSPPSFNEFINS